MRQSEFIRGMDLSTLLEVEARGGRFSDENGPDGAMEILRRHGMDLVRLRLWNDPYSPQGRPYGAGTNDLARTMTLAGRAKALGCRWLLDLHYSDFWADPGKQIPPKAWQGLEGESLERAVYDYTLSVLERLSCAGLAPDMVSVGNEITNGLLWPAGRYPDFPAIARLVSAGIRAVRQAAPGASVMLHLDKGTQGQLHRSWFDGYFAAGGADFDCIGLSYYPFWNGSIAELGDNIAAMGDRYQKDVIVAETSMGFTLEDYGRYEGLAAGERKGMAATAELAAGIAYPMTPAGQCDFLRDLAAAIRRSRWGRGLIWWEPAWIPVPGVGWATEQALEYTKEPGPGGNEWANQALFDYEGRALPAVRILGEI